MFSIMESNTYRHQDAEIPVSPIYKRQRYSPIVYPLGVAEDPWLSTEAKARYIERLTLLWAARNACPRGSIGHKDATAEIIAVTKEVMAEARECFVKQDKAQSQAQTIYPSLASEMVPDSSMVPADPVGTTLDTTLHQSQPTSQTASETLMITAMREHSAALNNHAAALDRHTAAMEKQMRGADHN